MIAETGAQERGPGEQASWIADMQSAVKARYPDLKALVYFDSNARYDWRVNTSPETLAAFTALARDPYFSPTASVGPCPASGPPGDVPCSSPTGIVYPPGASLDVSPGPTGGPGQAIGGTPASSSKPGHPIDPRIVMGVLVAAAAVILVIAFRTWFSDEQVARRRDRGG